MGKSQSREIIREENKIKVVIRAFVGQFFSSSKLFLAIPRYVIYFKEMVNYFRQEEAEQFSLFELSPRIHEKKEIAGMGGPGFYQNAWAYRSIYNKKPAEHVDIGSDTMFIGMLSAITKVTFIDIRPFKTGLPNLECKQGDILNIPYPDDSIKSLSCLHVIEHIGLGRYGDKLDPNGTKKAIKELQRVLTPNGNFYLSTPVGRHRINFNHHRVFSPKYIIDLFSDLNLIEISGLDRDSKFIQNIDIDILETLEYSIGLFHFTKKPKL